MKRNNVRWPWKAHSIIDGSAHLPFLEWDGNYEWQKLGGYGTMDPFTCPNPNRIIWLSEQIDCTLIDALLNFSQRCTVSWRRSHFSVSSIRSNTDTAWMGAAGWWYEVRFESILYLGVVPFEPHLFGSIQAVWHGDSDANTIMHSNALR